MNVMKLRKTILNCIHFKILKVFANSVPSLMFIVMCEVGIIPTFRGKYRVLEEFLFPEFTL